MNWRMLKKDFARKKSMNVILLLFILLATMFVTSSVNNLRVVTGGIDYFMEKAQIKNFLMLTMRENIDADDKNEQTVSTFLDKQKSVKKYNMDDVLYLAKSNLRKESGKEVEVKNSILINHCNIGQQKFYDMEDNEITGMKRGTIYLSYRVMEDNGFQKGDKITIVTENGYEKEFTVSGVCKDAALGSDLMGVERFIINEEDMDEMMTDAKLPYGIIYSVETRSQEAFVKDFNNQDFNVFFSCERSLIKMSYIMDMVIAAILMVVSLCLVLISVVMLRFIIIFTVNDDFREIGIMKAIGIPNGGIRRMYVAKYFVLVCVGAAAGLIGGIPFGNMLLRQATERILVPSVGSGIILQILVSVLLAAVIIGCAYLSTRRICKMTPMDAIRSGNTGERFHRKGVIRLKKWRFRTSSYLALNDICCEWKKYFIIFLMGIVGIWLLVMPLNTVNTLASEKNSQLFGVLKSDIYIVDNTQMTKLIVQGSREAYCDYLDEVKEQLAQKGIKAERISEELTFRMRVRKGDTSFRSVALQGINTKTSEYNYEEGTAPAYENEVALAYATAENIDAHVGDTVYVTVADEEKAFLVSAIYQSMNNLGEGIRFHEDAKLDYSSVAGSFGFQIDLEDDVDDEELAKIIDKVEELYPDALVETVQQFISSMVGNLIDKLEGLKAMILLIVVIINVLVIVLMQKMFLIKESGEIGMLKAVGFKTATIIRWQAKRIGIVLFAGMLIGTLSGTPFSRLTSGQVFSMMGARKVEFVINTWEVYIVYPVIVFVCAILASVITMRRVKKVSVQEMNNIE